MAKRILVINGPNLNLLGKREASIYGKKTLKEIEKEVKKAAAERGAQIEWIQSNHEGKIVECIHKARSGLDGIVINPAAFSHTSVAIWDALKAVRVPAVEVHISNIFGREEFRRQSLTASACKGIISGLGWRGYVYALINLLEDM